MILVALFKVVSVQAFAALTETVVTKTEPTDPEPVGTIDDKDESDPIRIALDYDRRRDGTRSLLTRRFGCWPCHDARIHTGRIPHKPRIMRPRRKDNS